jgi:MFS transporter, FHS family, glucose/mannose:H+ symporter
LIDADVAWSTIVVVSGLALLPLAIAYAVIPMPSGRSSSVAATTGGDPRRLLAGPILWLAIAIACYVAAEVGVSNWLVRFLEPAPLREATLALSLYWAGLAVGRLVSSVVSDRFDHLRFTVTCAILLAVALAGAILVPSLGWSIALFALAGVASGPIFPMILALGGERRPDRAAAVGGTLTGMAVVGSVVYPPAMGFLSVTVGLTAAMLGAVILVFASVGALVASGRSDVGATTDGASMRSDQRRGR